MKKTSIAHFALFTFIIAIFGFLSFFVREEIQNSANKDLQSKISVEAQSVVVSSQQLLFEYTGVIRSIRALFYASENVEKEEWHEYAKSLNLEENYPSIKAIEFIKRVKNDEDNDKESYLVHYIEPLEGNEAALGFDLYSNPARKKALELSRDTDSLVITEPITLVQEKADQKSFLMMLPIYQKGQEVASLDDRREHITGFALLVVRSGDFFSQVLSSNSLTNVGSFKVSDVAKEISFFSSQEVNDIGFLSKVSRTNIGARNWLYEFYSPTLKAKVVGVAAFVPYIILFLGIIISVLVSLVLFNSSKLKVRAEKIAKKLTHDLRKFKLAIESVSEQIVITDGEGIVLYANPATKEITGYTLNELVGKKAVMLWGKLMPLKYYKKMWLTIKTNKKTFDGEIKNKRKNGEEYLSQIKISPILNKSGKVIFFVGVERDITKEKRIDEMKTQFIAVASHQLRTPLSAIKWYLEIFLSGDVGKLDSKQTKLVKSIQKSNSRMITLVNGLLNISRIESGNVVVTPKKTSIKKLLNDVKDNLVDLVSSSKTKLKIEIDSKLKMVDIDPGLVFEVYKNLIVNAIKYSPNTKEILVKITKDGKDMLSQITDYGMGIPNEDKKDIFEKFYRGSNVKSVETDGSGLGLYLVKSVVESSGGKVWFESEENKGSTFWFTLPIKSNIINKEIK